MVTRALVRLYECASVCNWMCLYLHVCDVNSNSIRVSSETCVQAFGYVVSHTRHNVGSKTEHKKSQLYFIPEALVGAAYSCCITTTVVTWCLPLSRSHSWVEATHTYSDKYFACPQVQNDLCKTRDYLDGIKYFRCFRSRSA